MHVYKLTRFCPFLTCQSAVYSQQPILTLEIAISNVSTLVLRVNSLYIGKLDKMIWELPQLVAEAKMFEMVFDTTSLAYSTSSTFVAIDDKR